MSKDQVDEYVGLKRAILAQVRSLALRGMGDTLRDLTADLREVRSILEPWSKRSKALHKRRGGWSRSRETQAPTSRHQSFPDGPMFQKGKVRDKTGSGPAPGETA